jgi:tRNA (cytidine56-2'-O)-methyltransferase
LRIIINLSKQHVVKGLDLTISVLAVGSSTYSTSLDLCLTSRALGASEIIFIGKKSDSKILHYMESLNKKWGGRFKVKFTKSSKEALKSASKYAKVYLTRYGMPLQEKSYTLRTYKNMLLIVTLQDKDEMNPMHKIADFNISVSSQPHCSAAAIAIFLHEFYNGRELAMHFENAQFKLVPHEHEVEIKKLK